MEKAQMRAFDYFMGYYGAKNRCLGPQNNPESLGPKKLLKKYQSKITVLSSCNGGWPPISTQINPPTLGGNGIHCVEFPHQMRKLLLNLTLGEPLAVVEQLPCFNNLKELDLLLLGVLNLSIHNSIRCFLFHAVQVELDRCQLLYYLRCVQQWWKIWTKKVHIKDWMEAKEWGNT